MQTIVLLINVLSVEKKNKEVFELSGNDLKKYLFFVIIVERIKTDEQRNKSRKVENNN